jgi:hypothetical protein
MAILPKYDLTYLGTWQSSRKGFPKELEDFSNREAPSTEIYCEENGPLRIVSYVSKGRKKRGDPKKYNKSKLTTFLTTLEPFHGKFYNILYFSGYWTGCKTATN